MNTINRVIEGLENARDYISDNTEKVWKTTKMVVGAFTIGVMVGRAVTKKPIVIKTYLATKDGLAHVPTVSNVCR